MKSLKNDTNGLTKYRLTDLKNMVISGEQGEREMRSLELTYIPDHIRNSQPARTCVVLLAVVLLSTLIT